MSYAARSANSSSRRMASVRPGMSGCLRRHSSIWSRCSAVSRSTVENGNVLSFAMADAITDSAAHRNTVDIPGHVGISDIDIAAYEAGA